MNMFFHCYFFFNSIVQASIQKLLMFHPQVVLVVKIVRFRCYFDSSYMHSHSFNLLKFPCGYFTCVRS